MCFYSYLLVRNHINIQVGDFRLTDGMISSNDTEIFRYFQFENVSISSPYMIFLDTITGDVNINARICIIKNTPMDDIQCTLQSVSSCSKPFTTYEEKGKIEHIDYYFRNSAEWLLVFNDHTLTIKNNRHSNGMTFPVASIQTLEIINNKIYINKKYMTFSNHTEEITKQFSFECTKNPINEPLMYDMNNALSSVSSTEVLCNIMWLAKSYR